MGKARISFTVTEEEKRDIEEYCQRKRRWRTPSDLARDAVWQTIARNPVFKPKTRGRGTDPGKAI